MESLSHERSVFETARIEERLEGRAEVLLQQARAKAGKMIAPGFETAASAEFTSLSTDEIDRMRSDGPTDR